MTAMALYENRRTNFETVVKKYKEYLELYKSINHGSLAGATTFEDFYWDYTYYSKHSSPKSGPRL
jgi:hypothetical protein